MRSHRAALLATATLVALFFAPVLLRGHVLFPHDNSVEVGRLVPPSGEYVSNRTFTDQSCCYVPELNRHLNGDHAAWLSTWNPCVGLGRPSPHTFGFTKAFWLTHVLSWTTSDPFRLYTLLAAATVALTALFGLGLLRELGLSPAACFFGAAGLATGVFLTYWLSFVMFAATVCWAAALAWGIAAWCRRPSLGHGLLVALATHSLAMTGYPQQIVHHAYLLAAFSALCAWRSAAAPRRLGGALRRGLGLAGVGALGLLSTAPVAWDLALDASRSARFAYEREYFLENLPDLADATVLGRFATQLYDAFWWGNPISPRTGFEFVAVSLTPAYAALALASLGVGRRRGLWLAAAGVAALATAWPALYGFGVDHLGWDVSRFLPLASAWLPLFVLAALAADRLLEKPPGWRHPLPWLTLVPLALLLAGQGPAADPARTAVAVVLALGAAAFCATGRPALLLALAAATPFLYGQRLLLARPVASIHVRSELVDALRERTADGSRYAVLGRPSIPPNEEGLLDLRSVHTFDSLAPRAYQELVARLSRSGAINQGRIFSALDDEARLADDAFGYTGVATIVAERAPTVPGFEVLGRAGQRTLWARTGGAPTAAQLVLAAAGGEADAPAALAGPLGGHARLPLEVELRRDDLRRFRTTPDGRETLLFVSEQHHPHWRARAGDRELPTCVVNGFYLGVRLPPGTESVELRFRPAALWSWVPQLAFALAGLAWGAGALQRRRRSSASAAMAPKAAP